MLNKFDKKVTIGLIVIKKEQNKSLLKVLMQHIELCKLKRIMFYEF